MNTAPGACTIQRLHVQLNPCCNSLECLSLLVTSFASPMLAGKAVANLSGAPCWRQLYGYAPSLARKYWIDSETI